MNDRDSDEMGEGNVPLALVPVYRMEKPNQPFDLYSGAFEVDFGRGFQPIEHGVIRYEWVPKPMIMVHYSGAISFSDLHLQNGFHVVRVPGNEGTLRTQLFDAHSQSFFPGHVPPTEFKMDGGQGWAKLAVINTATKGEKTGFAQSIVHIVNFRAFIGDVVREVRPDGTSSSCRRMTLQGGGWKIELDSAGTTSDLIHQLDRVGGHAVTCLGRLERTDGGIFGVKELVEAIAFLDSFLCFANGDKCAVILPVAFDSEGVEVWRGWNANLDARWQGKPNWSHHWPAKFVAESFPGFLSRWEDPTWQGPVKTAIELYSQSKRGTVESILLLTQSVLELLCWVQFVEADKVITSTKDFEKKPASERIRLLLDRHAIPLAIPGILGELQAATHQGTSFDDGPHAITLIRNGIVHPKKSKREAMAGQRLVMDQAARLGLWYIETVLLKIFDYPHQASPYTLTYATQDGV